MKKAITIRPARSEDAESLLSLARAFDDSQNVSRLTAHTKASLQGNAAEEVYVADTGARLVGFLTLNVLRSFVYERPSAEITGLFVDPLSRRQGIGTELLALARHRCEELHCLEVYLRVNQANQGAKSVYAKAGMDVADHLVYRYKFYDRDDAHGG